MGKVGLSFQRVRRNNSSFKASRRKKGTTAHACTCLFLAPTSVVTSQRTASDFVCTMQSSSFSDDFCPSPHLQDTADIVSRLVNPATVRVGRGACALLPSIFFVIFIDEVTCAVFSRGRGSQDARKHGLLS